MSGKKYRSASIRQLRPHLALADDLGWTTLEMRNFMWSHGQLRMMGAKREQLLAVLEKQGIPYPPKKPPAALAQPPVVPTTQKPPPPATGSTPAPPAGLNGSTRPPRVFQPDVKRAVAELQQFQTQIMARLNLHPHAFDAAALVFVIRTLGYLRQDA